MSKMNGFSFEFTKENEDNISNMDEFNLRSTYNLLSDAKSKSIYIGMIYTRRKEYNTVRSIGNLLFVSKSLVHRYLKLNEGYCPTLYNEYRKIADYNYSIKHIHGGEATKNKYIRSKSKRKTKFYKRSKIICTVR